jgi:hypothetical protein
MKSRSKMGRPEAADKFEGMTFPVGGGWATPTTVVAR